MNHRLTTITGDLSETTRLFGAGLKLLENPRGLYRRCNDHQRRMLNQAVFELLYVTDDHITAHDLHEPFAHLHKTQRAYRRSVDTESDTAENDNRVGFHLETDPASDAAGLLSALNSGIGSNRPRDVEMRGAHYNLNPQVIVLEELPHQLPVSESLETPGSRRKPSGLPRRLKKLNADQKRELIDAYCDGATIYELAERFGIDRKTASRILYRQDVPTRGRGLSPAQAERTAHLRAAGWTLARIAEHFGVSARTVARRLGDRKDIR